MTGIRRICLCGVMTFLTGAPVCADDKAPSAVQFARGDGKITVVIDGLPAAVYYYKDDEITRPFFAHVRTPSGVQVTRHHPPIEGQDIVDHPTFHPGIWLSFGDINGSDYWRLKSRVRHAKFVKEPQGGPGRGTFSVLNEYLDQKDHSKVVCTELARYTFLVRPAGYLILWDSTFSSDQKFYFGDQEEMGLGFRMAAPLRVGASGKGNVPAGNGTILDSEGRRDEKEVWGNSAEWCDYSGTMAGQHVGLTIFCHPDNLRPSRFHARNYGLLVANEFGRKSFGKGEPSKVVVHPGEKLELRYGVLIHSVPKDGPPDLATAYKDYLDLVGK